MPFLLSHIAWNSLWQAFDLIFPGYKAPSNLSGKLLSYIAYPRSDALQCISDCQTHHTLSRWAQWAFIQREGGGEGTPPPWERERVMVKGCGRSALVFRRNILHWEMPRREVDFHDGSFHIDKGDLEMALAKHHYPFSALMRQLSESPCIKRAINSGEV